MSGARYISIATALLALPLIDSPTQAADFRFTQIPDAPSVLFPGLGKDDTMTAEINPLAFDDRGHLYAVGALLENGVRLKLGTFRFFEGKWKLLSDVAERQVSVSQGGQYVLIGPIQGKWYRVNPDDSLAPTEISAAPVSIFDDGTVISVKDNTVTYVGTSTRSMTFPTTVGNLRVELVDASSSGELMFIVGGPQKSVYYFTDFGHFDPTDAAKAYDGPAVYFAATGNVGHFDPDGSAWYATEDTETTADAGKLLVTRIVHWRGGQISTELKLRRFFDMHNQPRPVPIVVGWMALNNRIVVAVQDNAGGLSSFLQTTILCRCGEDAWSHLDDKVVVGFDYVQAVVLAYNQNVRWRKVSMTNGKGQFLVRVLVSGNVTHFAIVNPQ